LPPRGWRQVAQAQVRAAIVRVVDPRADGLQDFFHGTESMLPHAFALKRLVVGLDDAGLLGRVRTDELLSQAERRQQTPVETRRKEETVVAAHDHVGIAARQGSEALDAGAPVNPDEFCEIR
jgi:hypothetical protein